MNASEVLKDEATLKGILHDVKVRAKLAQQVIKAADEVSPKASMPPGLRNGVSLALGRFITSPLRSVMKRTLKPGESLEADQEETTENEEKTDGPE